ncbi:MAG: UvrD-helicase domain-containing protein [Thermus sp.]
MRPTQAQSEAIARFLQGKSFKLLAYAGSGKTTTLRLMAEAAPGRRILYLAFNRSVAEEAVTKFPKGVEVMTLHALAFRNAVSKNEALTAKFQARRGTVLVRDILESLEVPEVFGVPRYGVAVAVHATLGRFLTSDREAPSPEMVPPTALALVSREADRAEFARFVAGLAAQAWAKMRDPGEGFPLSHDGYIRIWAEMGAPGLAQYEAVLVDEAQDLNPSLLRPLLDYAARGGQLVAVGDRHQAIYAWRGAVNALDRLPGEALSLPESFRFGQEIADYVEALMEEAGRERLGLRGLGGPSEVVVGVGNPPRGAAFVYRTNAALIRDAAALAAKGYRVEVVGGVDQAASLVEAGVRLMRGEKVWHPELAFFRNYEEFLKVADLDPNLKALKKMLTYYGTRALDMVRALQRSGRGRRVDYTFSTAHKAKGLEWDHVVLGDDFPPREEATEEEWNLRYVAATRAKRVLDIRYW